MSKCNQALLGSSSIYGKFPGGKLINITNTPFDLSCCEKNRKPVQFCTLNGEEK